MSSHKEMPKATIEEQETIPPDQPEAQEELSAIPEEPVEEEVPVPKKKVRIAAKASAAKAKPKDAPRKTNLKDRHTCGACGKEMSLHTALYGHQNCPGKVSLPQPPALVRQVAVPERPEREEAPQEPPQMSQAQSLRLQLAHAAQERRAQAHMRMVTPIRSFYGL